MRIEILILVATWAFVCLGFENTGINAEVGQSVQCRDNNAVETREDNLGERDKIKMEEYYGTYKIVKFCPTVYYGNRKYDVLPEQEADMLIGRIVTIKEGLLETYDSERCFGAREGKDFFREIM